MDIFFSTVDRFVSHKLLVMRKKNGVWQIEKYLLHTQTIFHVFTITLSVENLYGSMEVKHCNSKLRSMRIISEILKKLNT